MYQWYQTSDTSPRAQAIYGSNPEPWDFHAHPAADIVLINLGTNDNNTYNNVSGTVYYNDYIKFVTNIHEIWPKAQIILISLWNGFSQEGNTWRQVGAFIEDIENVYQHFKSDGFVHYFNTTGIMQHNDIVSLYLFSRMLVEHKLIERCRTRNTVCLPEKELKEMVFLAN
jgi:hypothetical protein